MDRFLSLFVKLLWGTVIYRPYVYAFFACFLVFALRRLRWRGTAAYLATAFAIALASELSSTRIGLPFGRYVYVETTRSRELWLANVPFWDSLSFVFLSYFSWLVAACVRRPEEPERALGEGRTALVGGFLMMLLDVVIDPVALRGDRWFLGKVYLYPNGGEYFGVTLANFAGWWLVGYLIMTAAQRRLYAGTKRSPPRVSRREAWGALGVYAGVFLFNLAVTAWIREWPLFAASGAVAGLTIAFCARRIPKWS